MTNPSLKRLIEGNIRYVSGASTMDASKSRRDKVVFKQKPYAAIFGCVDSRVPPEIIFDAGIGELFVIRTAGSILDNAVIGSLAFAVEAMQIPLLMVLGHHRCGAVKTAIEVIEGVKSVCPEIDYIVESVKPAVERAKQIDGDLWNEATKIHIHSVMEQLSLVPRIKNAVQTGSLDIVGGWYDLETGALEILQPQKMAQSAAGGSLRMERSRS